jgi:drug/metabolite transporter (DMT)-like permease
VVDLTVIGVLISITLFAFTTLLTKYVIAGAGGPYRFLTIQLSVGLVIISVLFVIIFRDELIDPDIFHPDVLTKFFLACLFGFFGFVFLLIGLERGSASVGGIFISSRVIVNIPLAYIFLNEKYHYSIYLFILLTFIGALIVSWSAELSILDVILLKGKGTKYFLITMLFWGLSNIFVTSMGTVISPYHFLAYRQVIFVIAVWVLYPLISKKLDHGTPKLDRSFVKKLLLYISLALVAQVLFLYALQQSLTITEGLGVFEGVITFIITILFAHYVDNTILGEALSKRELGVKFIGVILSITGTVLVILSTI